MKASQKAFLMQCLSGLIFALGIFIIAIGLVELVNCQTITIIIIVRGFVCLVIGLSFVLASKSFDRSHAFYCEAIEQKARNNITTASNRTIPHDVRPNDREQSRGRPSRDYQVSMGLHRHIESCSICGGINCEHLRPTRPTRGRNYYTMGVDYAPSYGQSYMNIYERQLSRLREIQNMQLQYGMLRGPFTVATQQNTGINPQTTTTPIVFQSTPPNTNAITFNVLKNREMPTKEPPIDLPKEEIAPKIRVFNAISCLDLED